MLILAIGPIGTAGGFQFQALNDDRTDFVETPIILGFAAWGVGDKMQRPSDETSNLWVLDQKEINFLIKPVPLGEYVATYLTWNTFNGVSSGSAWACLDEGAYVFNIEPGTISLLSSIDAFPRGAASRLNVGVSEQDILEQFARTRLNYPNLKGDPVWVRPHAEARWTEKEGGLFAADCQKAEPGTLSLSKIASEDAAPTEPDEAELSAIAAALKNLGNQNTTPDKTGDPE